MKIKELEIKGLYGFMNKNIRFNDGINLLVGINGCGKTSILNILNWVTSLSLSDIATLDFQEIRLKFTKNEDEYILLFVQEEFLITISLITENQETFPPILIHLKIRTKELKDLEIRKRYRKYYQSLSPESNEIRTWRKLESLINSSIVIGLDRDYNTEVYDDSDLDAKHSPISTINKIARHQYSLYKSEMMLLNKRLHNSIMMSTFDKIYNEKELIDSLTQPAPNSELIDKLEEKIISYVKENSESNNNDQDIYNITLYFKDFKTVLSQEAKDENPYSYIINIHQMHKMRSLIHEFEEYEKKSDTLYGKINNYLSIVNSFLIDSSKKVYFKQTGELRYAVLDYQGNEIAKNKDIITLSSGEQQILIQFTYLHFCQNKDSLFMIDEPELSLHPKWLESYLFNVEKSLQKDRQVLIATHSPVIVHEKKENCIVLLPYNFDE